jgi:hypothetical protein
MSKSHRVAVVLLLAVTAVLGVAAPAVAKSHRKLPQCVVPKLTGDTLATARGRLTAAHCTLGTITEPQAKGQTLIVSATSPKAGKREKNKARVSVTLKAKTSAATTTPTTTVTTPTVTTPTVTTPTVTTPTMPSLLGTTTTLTVTSGAQTTTLSGDVVLPVTITASVTDTTGVVPDATVVLTASGSGGSTFVFAIAANESCTFDESYDPYQVYPPENVELSVFTYSCAPGLDTEAFVDADTYTIQAAFTAIGDYAASSSGSVPLPIPS